MDEQQLPSLSTLLEYMSKKRALDKKFKQWKVQSTGEKEMIIWYFLHHTHAESGFKARYTDLRPQQNFQKACATEEQAKEIERKYVALLERKTWTIQEKPRPESFPVSLEFQNHRRSWIGPTSVLHKAPYCIQGDKKVENRDFDSNNLYASVVGHGNIQRFLAKAVVQNLMVDGVDVSNANLYGEIDKPIIMEHLTNCTG